MHHGCELTITFSPIESSPMPVSFLRLAGALSGILTAGSLILQAEPIHVRYRQGSSHGFVGLKALNGALVAVGEVTQTVHGDEVTSRLVLRFPDGSVDDDLTTFTQHDTFRLVRDHHTQHGPSFPKPIDILVEAGTGQITSRTEDGKATMEHLDLPSDLANGMPPNLLLNILPSTPETTVSYVAPGSKPRLIHISIKPTGTLPFRIGGMRRKATEFTLHVELGGLAGVVAPMVGKAPSDYRIWIMPGVPPAVIREEGPLYEGGPVWRLEQISPRFSH